MQIWEERRVGGGGELRKRREFPQGIWERSKFSEDNIPGDRPQVSLFSAMEEVLFRLEHKVTRYRLLDLFSGLCMFFWILIGNMIVFQSHNLFPISHLSYHSLSPTVDGQREGKNEKGGGVSASARFLVPPLSVFSLSPLRDRRSYGRALLQYYRTSVRLYT